MKILTWVLSAVSVFSLAGNAFLFRQNGDGWRLAFYNGESLEKCKRDLNQEEYLLKTSSLNYKTLNTQISTVTALHGPNALIECETRVAVNAEKIGKLGISAWCERSPASH